MCIRDSYYTDADMNVSLHILDKLEEKQAKSGVEVTLGELRVSTIVKVFKKMKLDTHENLGFGEVRLPQSDMPVSYTHLDVYKRQAAFWLLL